MKTANITHQIHFSLLAPFSLAIMLFVSDLSGATVIINILYTWARRLMISNSSARF